MTQTRSPHPSPLTPCHMLHSQNFDKIDNFLKPVLNIFILRNLTVGWGGGGGGGVLKEGTGILDQICKFKGDINTDCMFLSCHVHVSE